MVCKYTKIDARLLDRVSVDVKGLLHASRDCLRNLGKDTSRIRFDIRDGYYSEAFGVMRGLQLLGYGYFGSVNVAGDTQKEHNLRWWFERLCDNVLREENYGGSNECDYCLLKWGKDGAGRTRR